MPTSDLPNGTASGGEALDFDEGVSALEDLLSDPAPDLGSGKNPAKNTPSKAKAEDIEDDDDEAEGDEPPDDDDAEDDEADDDADADEEEGEEDDEDDDEEDDDDPRSAVELDDETVIDLGDGRKATLADLKQDFGNVQKRVADFQRHFTARTQEVADYERKLQTAEEKVIAAAQEVRQQRELIYAYGQAYMPQPPQRPELSASQDPVGWMEYEERKEDYERHRQYIQRIRHAQDQAEARRKAEEAEKMPQIIAKEVEKLHERYPSLKDPVVGQRTMGKMVEVFQREYGITPQEISKVYDHRTMAVMLDALAFRELDAKKAKVTAKVAGKPESRKALRAGKRGSSADQRRHGEKARLKRLRDTGSLDAAAESLMDFSDLFE